MTVTRLPSALAAWSEQLSAVRPDIAVALGPLLHRLDELVGRHSTVDGPEGPPDGFGGLARRGDPQRLLVSEWALAEELPDEFVRRAAGGELLYLDPARRNDVAGGHTVLLLDTGPDLQGAPRLVQLALALVLHRRAVAVGADLRIGVLTAPAGSWLAGDLPAALEEWLGTRARRPSRAEDLRDWLATVDEPDRAWIVVPEHVARGAPAAGARPARLLTVAESDWAGGGPSAVVVGLAGERAHLPLPASKVGVRLLRGDGWRRRDTGPQLRRPSRAAGAPRLPGSAPVLFTRGGDACEIVTQRVPGHGAAGRPRVHRLPGPVLAASTFGSRLVVLIAVDGFVETRVIGKRLAAVDRISNPLAELGLEPADVESITAAPPAEVYFRAGDLLVRLAGSWWQLSVARRAAMQPTLACVAPSQTIDNPAVVARSGTQLWLWRSGHGGRYGPVPLNGPVPETHLGSDAIAWRDSRGWRLADVSSQAGRDAPGIGNPSPDHGLPVAVESGATVLGVTRIRGDAGLVTVGNGGVLVRFVTARGTRTLTRWSGGEGLPAVHARRPLIAVRRADGTIEVGDLTTDRVLLRLAGGT